MTFPVFFTLANKVVSIYCSAAFFAVADTCSRRICVNPFISNNYSSIRQICSAYKLRPYDVIESLLLGLAVLCFYSKTGFWPSYCHISTDLDIILHTPVVVRNTLVGRLRPRLARGRLQAKPERLCFL